MRDTNCTTSVAAASTLEACSASGISPPAVGHRAAQMLAMNAPDYVPSAVDTTALEEKIRRVRRPSKSFAGTPAATVKPRRRRWLWRSWVPLGTLSLLYGEEGLGKGNVSIYIAAGVTRGTLPGDLDGIPGDVDIVTFEDDPEIDLVPRLLAAGADLERVTFHAESDAYESPLTLPDDVADLGEAMRERQSRLLIIDPLPDALREGLKDNNNGDVRTGIVPLQQMAKQLDAAVLGVAHPNKGATTAANKVMGSKAWRSVPRSVIMLGKNPDDIDGDTRVMCVTKRNGAREKPSQVVRLEDVEVDALDADGAPVGRAPRVVVVGDSDYTDEDLVVLSVTGKASGAGKKAATQSARAELLIIDLMIESGGSISAAAAYAAGAAEGIGEATMRRARQALKVNVDGRDWCVGDDWVGPLRA
jgi:hypothetical protein